MDELFVLLIFKIHLDYALKQTKIMIQFTITLDFSLMTKNYNSEPIKSTSSIYYTERKIIYEAFLEF